MGQGLELFGRRRNGQIALVNSQLERLFGYPREELLGQSVDLLVPERYRGHHERRRTGFFSQPRARAMGAGLELYGQRRDGSEFPVEISLSPLETEEGLFVSGAIRDAQRAAAPGGAPREAAHRRCVRDPADNFLLAMARVVQRAIEAIDESERASVGNCRAYGSIRLAAGR